MIITNFKSLSRYKGISKNLDITIDHLLSINKEKIKIGSEEIDGKNIYMNVMEYETIPLEFGLWESHIAYIDVHFVLEGSEKIGVSDSSELVKEKLVEEDDFIGWSGKINRFIELKNNDILILFPEDVHMVKLIHEEESHVKKVVVKVKI